MVGGVENRVGDAVGRFSDEEVVHASNKGDGEQQGRRQMGVVGGEREERKEDGDISSRAGDGVVGSGEGGLGKVGPNLGASRSNDARGGARDVSVFLCKKCRIVVATLENVQMHEPGDGPLAFSRWPKKGAKSQEAETDASTATGEAQTTSPIERLQQSLMRSECSSIFVEPQEWMMGVEEGERGGKLCCKKCSARLGNFDWAGLQCSCGAWVTPAFQLHKSRVDSHFRL